MFILKLKETHWISDKNTEMDLCAHGTIFVKIGNEVVVNNDSGTISATALFLLRTLERDHTKDNPVGVHLFPCCGHFLVFTEGMTEVFIGGCTKGDNWEVRHKNEMVELKTQNSTNVLIEFENYKNQILKFVDQVEQFYTSSKEKVIPTDEFDKTGYLHFWKEWKERRKKWHQ